MFCLEKYWDVKRRKCILGEAIGISKQCTDYFNRQSVFMGNIQEINRDKICVLELKEKVKSLGLTTRLRN